MKWIITALLITLPMFVHGTGTAASSELIVPPDDSQSIHCREKLQDHIYIAQVVAGGTPRGKFEAHAKRAQNLTPDHLEEILKLMNEAYAAKDVTEWLQGYWGPCMREEES